MKKHSFVYLAAAAAVLGGTTAANAQMGPTTPLAVEVRGGLTFPQSEFKDEGLESGWTAGVEAQLRLSPLFSVYGGYEVNKFQVDNEVAEDVDVTANGLRAGLVGTLATPGLPVQPFVKGGIVFHQLGLDAEDPEADADRDGELGFEIGGGVRIPLGERVSFTPAFSYTQFTSNDDDEGTTLPEVDVKFLKVDVGLNFRI